MHVLITGGTGFVGSAVVLRLLRDGHTVSVWTRQPEAAPAIVGGEARIVDAKSGAEGMRFALEEADAVINLAGESVVSRWSDAQMKKLRASRVNLTRQLVDSMIECEHPPRVFLSASAIGYYGSDGQARFDENSPPGDDFLARLCVEWEQEALRAKSASARVCIYRIGIVLGDGGGALSQMLPVFRLGAGGILGDGKQWMSWIHLDDLVEMIGLGLQDAQYDGALNAVAPEPAQNRDFTKTLAELLKKPAMLRVPKLALRLRFGRGSSALLASHHVSSIRLDTVGFRFRFPSLKSALSEALHRVGSVDTQPAPDPPKHPYLDKRGARHLLRQTTEIDAPLREVFPFFADAANLGALTPPSMDFRIITPMPIDMRDGVEIRYRIRLGPTTLRWKTIIEKWNPQTLFVDAQHRGPYRAWYHEHEFIDRGRTTLMIDRVWYKLPLGPLGRVIHAWFIGPMLKRIFEYRATRVRFRFGATSTGAL